MVGLGKGRVKIYIVFYPRVRVNDILAKIKAV